MKLTKNVDPDKYRYSGCSIGIDARSKFSWEGRSWGKCVICGADNSSSVHEKKKDIKITAEVKCPINFTRPGRRFVLSLDYNENNIFLFVNVVKMY